MVSVSSVQFSRSVMSPWTAAHQAPCLSPTPRVYSNSCPLSQWCHPTISSSLVPFSSCLQSFPAWGSFQMSQLFASGGQSIGVSASASVLPMNIQDWFPLGWTSCWEKYQQPQICRWLQLYGKKWRTKEPLDDSERGEWKSWLKTQHSEN